MKYRKTFIDKNPQNTRHNRKIYTTVLPFITVLPLLLQNVLVTCDEFRITTTYKLL